MMTLIKLFTLVFLINFFECVRPDAVSLSIVGLEQLVVKEKFLIDNLELYVGALEKKVEVIRSNLKVMKAENEKAHLEGDAYLMNPLKVFPLMRRLHTDWLRWQIYLQNSVGNEYVENIISELKNVPSAEETNEAADAMFRLQYTYDLDPKEMATGILDGVQYDAKLSTIDCYFIGRRLHETEKHMHAAPWLESALNLLDEQNSVNEVLNFDDLDIFYYYAHTLAKQDKLSEAITVIDRFTQRYPTNEMLIQQKILWQMEIEAKNDMSESRPEGPPMVVAATNHQLACQGKFPARIANLHCIYNTTTHPFLKLAPLKMEQLSLDPYVILYHDVISDSEIEALKSIALPKLDRALVYEVEKHAYLPSVNRTSKLAWFTNNYNEVTMRLSQRLEDMTGFGMETADLFQTMNYGVGGHYDLHYDFYNLSGANHITPLYGDRVATAMFYLSDVQQGGATVFPVVKLGVYPKKGACIFWHNLNPRGEVLPETLHSACPVIVGSKWVCNKWIREEEQIFKRPCPREN